MLSLTRLSNLFFCPLGVSTLARDTFELGCQCTYANYSVTDPSTSHINQSTAMLPPSSLPTSVPHFFRQRIFFFVSRGHFRALSRRDQMNPPHQNSNPPFRFHQPLSVLRTPATLTLPRARSESLTVTPRSLVPANWPLHSPSSALVPPIGSSSTTDNTPLSGLASRSSVSKLEVPCGC
jgi:hypothetical protein